MLVVVRPGSGVFQLGHVAALACALSVALYQIFTKWVTRTSSAKLTLFFMAATATALTSLIVPFTWKMPETTTWLHLAGLTLVYAAGHAMYIVAHSRAEASRLAPLVYFQLAGSISGGFLFYGQVPQIYTLLGGALIALGGCIALLPLRRRVTRTV
jgi:drug/metabolite transporter (DMT)-like permease